MTLFVAGRDLPLPQLDDRRFEDLVEEARALIPAYQPDWTDHNASDPGITLIELLAWVTEMLIYRAHQVTREHLVTFLRLLNGPQWPPQGWSADDLDGAIAQTLRELRTLSQAVTAADHEELAAAVEVRDPAGAHWAVGRVHCVARRNLTLGTEPQRTVPAPGEVSLVIVPRPLPDPAGDPSEAWQPPLALRDQVAGALEPSRTLTTRLHVVGPVIAPLTIWAVVARLPAGPSPERVRDAVAGALGDFLHPLTGGSDGRGAPFGRPVYAAELYALLERVEGVDHVPELLLNPGSSAGLSRAATPGGLWNEDGSQRGLELQPHHLPRLVQPAEIVVGEAFTPVAVTATVRAPASVPTHALVGAVRRRFSPAADGPTPDRASDWSTTSTQIATDLRAAGATDLREVGLTGDPARVHTDPSTGVATVTVPAGELVEVVAVDIAREGE